MYLDVYIGDLTDTGYHDGDPDTLARTPHRLSPLFPASAPFWLVMHLVEDGDLPGRQTDWGAWTAVVTKRQLLDVLDEAYPPAGRHGRAWLRRVEADPAFFDGEGAGALYARYRAHGDAWLTRLAKDRDWSAWWELKAYCEARALRECVEALPDDGEYALVAMET